MALVVILVFSMAMGLGAVLRIALLGRSRRIASIAGWVLLAFPALVIAVMLLKYEGPMFYFLLPPWMFPKWLGYPLAVIMMFVPLRSAWRRAQVYRDEAVLLEQARVLDPARWPELGYQELADRLGVPAVPIFMSKDVTTSYAIGVRARRIVVPASWVPERVRGGDEYWSDVPDSPTSAADLRAVLAHELAHHRDFAGLRGVLMEVAGYLFPWEFITGTAGDYHRDVIGTPRALRARGVAARLSKALVNLGRLVWRGGLEAERIRQERLADAEAERVFPPSREIIASMRGFLYEAPKIVPSTAAQVVALTAGVCFLGLGLLTLPGRAAWPRLVGGDGPIPWHLPIGWSISEWTPPDHVDQVGFIPGFGDRSPRVRIEYSGKPGYARNSFGMFSGWIRFHPNTEKVIPQGGHLQVDWPVTYIGTGNPWIQTTAKDHGIAFIRLTLDKIPAEGLELKRAQVEYDGQPTCELAGPNRTILHMNWGPFNGLPLGGTTLLLGVVLNHDSPGRYEFEPPALKVVSKDGSFAYLDDLGFDHQTRGLQGTTFKP